MSVSEKDSGIVEAHVKAIEGTAAAMNTFIFIRPTEFDSTILIKAGYATKSMDVHHKSSNWGPMAGFVPCDPAFSKKCEGKPNPNEHEHAHGAAAPVQLSLKNSLLLKHTKIAFKTEFELARTPAAAKEGFRWIVKRKATGGPATGVAAARAKFENFQDPFPEHQFCTAEPAEIGNKSTLFVLTETSGEWLVWWVEWKGDVGLPRPLRVFGYTQKSKVVPVTGDYDLWMVAPHFTHFDQAAAVRIAEDVHGASAASNFTLALNDRMNASCGRSDNPVFNHGAESQNYGFTQALDWNLAMFTPGGTSRMVRMNQMPAILGDLQRAGYLVVWNKRYGEADPRLMSKADSRGESTLAGIRETLERLYGELNRIRTGANHTEIKSQFESSVKSGTPRLPGIVKHEIEVMAQRFQATRELGGEQSRIYRFHRELLQFLEGQMGGRRALATMDFPGGVRTYEARLIRLHAELQKALVAATTDKGQSSDQQLREWLTSHRTEIETLKTYWA
jgi:hypothetical protein